MTIEQFENIIPDDHIWVMCRINDHEVFLYGTVATPEEMQEKASKSTFPSNEIVLGSIEEIRTGILMGVLNTGKEGYKQ